MSLTWYTLLNIDTTPSLSRGPLQLTKCCHSFQDTCCVQADSSDILLENPNLPLSFIGSITNACSELLNNTQCIQNTPFSDSISHPLIFIQLRSIKVPFSPTNIYKRKTNDGGTFHFFFSEINFLGIINVLICKKTRSKLFGCILVVNHDMLVVALTTDVLVA